jgi:hypothetical protein
VGAKYYQKALYLNELSDAAITVITEYQLRKTSPRSRLELFRLGGAYAEVGEDETAFGGSRSVQFTVNMIAVADSSELLASERTWVRSFWDALLWSWQLCQRHGRVRGRSGAGLLQAGQV